MDDRSDCAPVNEREKEILRKRAKKLAHEIHKEGDRAEDLLEVVEFRLGDERYAIASTCVGEIFPLREITPLPCTPPFVAGIVNLRGRIVSIVDLKFFFELPSTEHSNETRIVVLRSGDMELGVLADALAGVRTLSLRDINPPLPTMTGVRAAYLLGLEGEDTVVLDGRKLLGDG